MSALMTALILALALSSGPTQVPTTRAGQKPERTESKTNPRHKPRVEAWINMQPQLGGGDRTVVLVYVEAHHEITEIAVLVGKDFKSQEYRHERMDDPLKKVRLLYPPPQQAGNKLVVRVKTKGGQEFKFETTVGTVH